MEKDRKEGSAVCSPLKSSFLITGTQLGLVLHLEALCVHHQLPFCLPAYMTNIVNGLGPISKCQK